MLRADTAGSTKAERYLDPPACRHKQEGWEPCDAMSVVLKGSWDLVTRVIIKVAMLKIITYNPN